MMIVWWMYAAAALLQLWTLPALLRRVESRRRSHSSSRRPYTELPRVSGRPAIGALPHHPEIKVVDLRAVGITAQEAGDTLARSMRAFLGVPEPLPPTLRLFGPCPRCGQVDTHLLGERDTATYNTDAGTVGPSIGRECRNCRHTWRERLDG